MSRQHPFRPRPFPSTCLQNHYSLITTEQKQRICVIFSAVFSEQTVLRLKCVSFFFTTFDQNTFRFHKYLASYVQDEEGKARRSSCKTPITNARYPKTFGQILAKPQNTKTDKNLLCLY
jgi:hypothetical protein